MLQRLLCLMLCLSLLPFSAVQADDAVTQVEELLQSVPKTDSLENQQLRESYQQALQYARDAQRYREQGLVVLGLPCNQFGAQEPGDAEEIASFCQQNYGVSFPMFARIEVNGEHAHPLYQYLKKAAPGLLGSEGIKWNFTKFLVDRDGEVVQRYAPATAPEAIADDIEPLL